MTEQEAASKGKQVQIKASKGIILEGSSALFDTIISQK
jgi:hypothetical protein